MFSKLFKKKHRRSVSYPSDISRTQYTYDSKITDTPKLTKEHVPLLDEQAYNNASLLLNKPFNIQKEQKNEQETAWSDDIDRELNVYLDKSNEIKENIKRSRDMVQYCHNKLNGIMYIEVINEYDKKEIANKLTEASNISTQSRTELYKLRISISTITSEQQKRMCVNILSSLMKSFSSLLREIEIVSELLIRKSGTTFNQITMESPSFDDEQITVSQDKVFASLAHMYQKEMEQEIKNLEKSVVELHQLFVDTATLIETQGQVLDMIEPSIFETIGQTNNALHMLQAAESHKKSSRLKKALIITIIGITILVIIVACVAVVCIIAGV